MAGQYIAEAYVDAVWGTAFRVSIFGESGTDLNQVAKAATARVQAAMRNSGYAISETENPDEVDELVKLAVMGVFWEMASTRPGASVALPENWDESPFRTALGDILTGAAMLAAAPSSELGVGGVKFTSSTDSPQVFSRENLEGY